MTKKKDFVVVGTAIKRSTINAVLRKIEYQRLPGPEGRLLFSVFECAVRDYFFGGNSGLSAIRYLTKKMIPHLEAIGVDTSWAIGLFKAAGYPIMPPAFNGARQ